jgi:type II secretory pathway predicted ATPase ExeA
MSNYKIYFGFKDEPFSNNIKPKFLLKLPSMLAVKQRFDYVSDINGVMLITGDVGSGKSTSLRWAISHYHKSEYLILNIVANTGAIIEFYKQVCFALGINIKTMSRAVVIKKIKDTIKEIAMTKKQKVILVIDEAQLLRADIFAEVHTLTQFNNDSLNHMAIIFAGQASLFDKFTYRNSLPLASRVIAKTHLTGINKEQMTEYINHHTKVAGVRKNIFDDNAILAIQQGSAGILRKANALAKGGLIASAIEKTDFVNAEHIRIASTELIN